MKKVVLGAMALMCGTVVFGQNTSSVTQTGDDNESEVIQVIANDSWVEQIGDDNESGVFQVGWNDSEVYQHVTITNQVLFKLDYGMILMCIKMETIILRLLDNL